MATGRLVLARRHHVLAPWTSQDSLDANVANANESDCAAGQATTAVLWGMLFYGSA